MSAFLQSLLLNRAILIMVLLEHILVVLFRDVERQFLWHRYSLSNVFLVKHDHEAPLMVFLVKLA